MLNQQIGTANKRAMFLNLLYRALQQDKSMLRLYAFIKRTLQVTIYFPANMICATLYVVSKILHGRRNLRQVFLEPYRAVKIEKDNVCEVNDNLSDSEDIHVINESEVKEEQDSIKLSNVMIDVLETEPDIKAEMQDIKSYDPFCRNPLYAGVSKGFNTELVALSKHFHPSVALFANMIIQGII